MHKETEYANAVARVRFAENRLLSKDDLELLLSSDDLAGCLKILEDKGFLGVESKNIDLISREEMNKLWSFVKEILPYPEELDMFLYENDFHNLKAAIRNLYVGYNHDDLFLTPCTVSLDLIKECVKTSDFVRLPVFCKDYAKKAKEVLFGTGNGQLCDVILDKGYMESMLSYGKKSDNRFLNGLCNLIVAYTDLKIVLRGVKLGKTRSFYDCALCGCEILSVSDLRDNALLGGESLIKYISNINFLNEAEVINSSVYAFERWCNNSLMDYVSTAKYKALGIEPIVAYIFAKQAEIKSVRIILYGKQSLISADDIRGRVRRLYG